MTKKIYGRLTILREGKGKIYNGKNIRTLICRCLCGNEKEIVRSSLISGLTNSCGCLARENTIKRSTKHGYATKGISKTYSNWHKMIDRCHNKKDLDYRYYGARGIKVCERWRESILNFVEDMGEKPLDKTLDRIDNDGNYCKENCKWATRSEQQQNTRKSKGVVSFTYLGETKTVKEWSIIKNIPYGTLRNRIFYYKLPVEKIFDRTKLKKK